MNVITSFNCITVFVPFFLFRVYISLSQRDKVIFIKELGEEAKSHTERARVR